MGDKKNTQTILNCTITFITSSSVTIWLKDPFFVECVLKVDILILLKHSNLLCAIFQLEFGYLFSFLTG